MRRMTTNRQINFIDKASKVIEVNNLEEVIKIPFSYVNLEEIETMLEGKIEDKELDFETHTLKGAWVSYYYTEDLDKDEGYITMAVDVDISFPETISTVAVLAKWLAENLTLTGEAYIDDINNPDFPEKKWYDFGDQEFDFINNVLYLIGYVNFSQEDDPILQIGTPASPIPEIYAWAFYGSLGSPDRRVAGDFSTLTTQLIEPRDIKAYPGNNIINVLDNLKLVTGKYLQAPYLYGQLGSNNTKSNAYVNTLVATGANIGGLGIEKITSGTHEEWTHCESGAGFSLSADAGLELFSLEGDISFNSAEGDVSILTGDDGNIKLQAASNIIMLNLPTSDPHVANALWNDSGVLKISLG